jgi:hypothetical protein
MVMTRVVTGARLGAAALLLSVPMIARADEGAFLGRIHHFTTLGSTVPANGDQNPYAIVVAPVTAGPIHEGDVLVDNFNDRQNLQGLGSTIVDYRPSTAGFTTIATIPRHLAGCPGGIGLTTAMTMLSSGWIIVGSLPSQDGSTATKGDGCLVTLSPQGQVASVIADPRINGPWGNMAVIDRGSTATIFLSNTGFGVGAPGQPVVDRANVLRLGLTIEPGKPPALTTAVVVADGFGEQADAGVFIIGPTGLALGKGGVLFVSDALGNRIAAIPDAEHRTTSAGVGQTISRDGMLRRPLAIATAPNGDLLVTNALNGQVVEIDPTTGKQPHALWIDNNRAQTPPGNGDLFGIAMTPAGDGIYYVKDDMNTLVLGH